MGVPLWQMGGPAENNPNKLFTEFFIWTEFLDQMVELKWNSIPYLQKLATTLSDSFFSKLRNPLRDKCDIEEEFTCKTFVSHILLIAYHVSLISHIRISARQTS